MEIYSYFFTYLFLLSQAWKLVSTARITIAANTPVNPVKTGGILSLHCRIWNLDRSHTVSIYRKVTGSHSEILTVNDDVLPAIEDRVFLAVRQLPDGSAVYFLSITDITRNDQGAYSCKVVGTADNDETVTLAREVADVEVQYFPVDSNPLCTPNEALTLTEGKLTTFNCSAEAANPTVEMRWVKTGHGKLHQQNQATVRDGVVYNELQIVPTISDKGKMFICQITSPVFPDAVQSCHIGPVDIIRDPNIGGGSSSGGKDPNAATEEPPKQGDGRGNSIETAIETTVELTIKSDCLKACSTTLAGSPASYWIIATVVAGILALTFLLIGIILIVKYNRIHVVRSRSYAGTTRQLPPNLNREYIYSELEHKPLDSQVYMSLDKRVVSDKLNANTMEQLKGHYHVASLVQPS